ncbi:2-dehydro-3-deoxyphosphogluconate aldolase / (4S)-4-hydroxy-2-oxoglutarate aldolase [Halobacillus alkaliphilus]|uniref:2-dehydro-3-deoxyphosphogluconate aldolase / (4S)-4-hydroxy-2-oxoglutarate aldolase n=1 Tax=Halobacillus alkaliphilus TaxID=396056 RepID=A0A1I2LXE8_9BACI|nr:bifunctional 4-hydroxy-2-oxoglutarate aldolase/2-dehydro-3-deoxy-phosphogluconate aldolase [Halobacillus alkaliphilus]SFF83238.1 2-dehydro-3-deoxyphosphogluconate aldolase / (4S)-4-hydroxy-2-oxoglutarate aldolase [Halobacillus alkaliphilus]
MAHLQQLKNAKVVPVIRKAQQDQIVSIAKSLQHGGIKAIEITAETPGCATMIEQVKQECKGDFLVGAGTVLDGETAIQMIASGADFIVAPTLSVETIRAAKRYGKVCIPGAFTPTEILTAYEYGADMVKVFPASTVGPGLIKSIKGPLSQISIMATGGIHLSNMNEFLDGGAEVVGIGSQLVSTTNLNSDKDYERLEELAKEYMDQVSVMEN